MAGRVIAQGQLTLVDLTDIISQPLAPTPAKEGMLWMNTTPTPPVLMVYRNSVWVKQNDFKDTTEYTTMTETINSNKSFIDINKTKIEQAVSQDTVTTITTTAIGNIQIGGRNLMKNSSLLSWGANNIGTGTSVLSSDSTGSYMRATPDTGKSISLYYHNKVSTGLISAMVPNATYSLSLDVRIPVAASVSLGGTTNGFTMKAFSIPANTWTRIRVEGLTPTATDTPSILTFSTLNTVIDYRNYKIEEGTKSSNWTPAQEDTDGKIDKLSTGVSKWLLELYPYDATVIGNNIDISHIAGKNPTQTLLMSDTNTNWTIGDNYFGRASTNVYLDADYSLATTLKIDDGGTLYLNGVVIGSTSLSTETANITLPFKKGWNIIEVVYRENTSSDGFILGSKISTLTQVVNMNAYSMSTTQTSINNKFAGIATSLESINLDISEMSTATYVTDVENTSNQFMIGVGTNQTNKAINAEVKDSQVSVELEGLSLVNLNPTQNYSFSIDTTANAGRYTSASGSKSATATITSTLTSWYYVSAGSIKKEMIKPNTEYTVFFGRSIGVKTVAFQSGDATQKFSNGFNVVNNKCLVTTLATLPAATQSIAIYCSLNGIVGAVDVKDVMVIEGNHINKDISYFDNMLSIGELDENLFIRGYKGQPNLLQNSNFDKRAINNSIGWDNALNGTYTATNWTFYNGGVASPTTGYHAHLYNYNGEIVVRQVEQASRWKSATYAFPYQDRIKLKKGVQYTYSFDIWTNTIGSVISGGLYYYRESVAGAGFHNGQYSYTATEANVWKTFTYTFTMPTDLSLDLGMSIYHYGDNCKGTNYIKNFKLEEGSIATPYTLSITESSNSETQVLVKDTEDVYTKPVLKGIYGTIYKDTIKKHTDNKSYYHKKCNDFILNGTEAWTELLAQTNTIRFKISLPLDAPISKGIINAVCDKIRVRTSEAHGDYEYIYLTNGSLYLNLLKSRLATADLAGFQAWLVANNVKVVYELYDEQIFPCEPLIVQGYTKGSVYIDSIIPPDSKHTVSLNSMAVVESSSAAIDMTKNTIAMKVDKNGVIAAINMGIEDDESNVKIMADRIKLQGVLTVENMSSNLSDVFYEDGNKTKIDGGYIKSGSIDLEGDLKTRGGLTVTDRFAQGEKTTFQITPEGKVYIAGTIESFDYTTNGTTGWRIDESGNAIFNQGEFRSKMILPQAGMSNDGNVRIWAGDNYPSSAPFRVMSNGDIYAEKGYFKGTFSGYVEVGGITISDLGKMEGRASITVTDNTTKLITEIAEDKTVIGTEFSAMNTLIVDKAGLVKVSNTDFNFNDVITLKESDSSISFNSDFANFSVNGTQFNFKINDTSQTTDFEFSNPNRDTIVDIKGQLKVASNVDIGVVTIRKMNDGIDFLFI